MIPNRRLRLAFGQRRGRLVEDQHAAVERQRLGDLDQLLVGNGEVGNPGRTGMGASRFITFCASR